MWSQIPSLGAAPQKGLRSPRCCPDPWGDLLAAVVLGTEACLRLPLSPPGWLSWLVVVGGGGRAAHIKDRANAWRILPRQPEVSLPADRAAALSSCPSAKG